MADSREEFGDNPLHQHPAGAGGFGTATGGYGTTPHETTLGGGSGGQEQSLRPESEKVKVKMPGGETTFEHSFVGHGTYEVVHDAKPDDTGKRGDGREAAWPPKD